MSYAREKCYSVPDLKARGWTATAIRKFLPEEPDDTRENPHYSTAGAAMKLWLRTRVHRVEKTKLFLAWKEGVGGRRRAAAAAVATRTENMAERMRTVEITIERGLTDEQIHRLAERTHGGNYQGEPGPFSWSNRTARNCIRHNLTNYESLWNLCNRGETGAEAYEILRERVDELICDVYPQYAHEDTPDSIP